MIFFLMLLPFAFFICAVAALISAANWFYWSNE